MTEFKITDIYGDEHYCAAVSHNAAMGWARGEDIAVMKLEEMLEENQ